jgi:hypothetical protein
MKFLIGLNAFYFFYITLIGLFLLKSRIQAVKNKSIDPRYFASYQGEVPKNLKILENHFNNQFQVPPLFMITSLFALYTNSLSPLVLSLFSIFIVSRLIHTYIHLKNNYIPYRAVAYFAGFLILALIWLIIFFSL